MRQSSSEICLQEQKSNEISEGLVATQQQVEPRFVLRDKSDNSHKIRISSIKPAVCITHQTEQQTIPTKAPDEKNRSTTAVSNSNKIQQQLFEDILDIFMATKKTKIRSKHLLRDLCSDSAKPWATFRRGRNLNYQGLCRLLKEFGIHSKDMRFTSRNFKGYQKEWFVDAKSRIKATKIK